MTGPITWEMGTLIVAVVIATTGVLVFFDRRIRSAFEKFDKKIADSIGLVVQRSDLVSNQLSEFKEQVAKEYMLKADARSSFDQVMEGVRDIRQDVKGVHARIDAIVTAKDKPQ